MFIQIECTNGVAVVLNTSYIVNMSESNTGHTLIVMKKLVFDTFEPVETLLRRIEKGASKPFKRYPPPNTV